MRSAPSATPTCVAHNPTSARSSIHAVARRPSTSSPPPRRSARAPAKPRCATLDRSVVAATVRSTPGPPGSTRQKPSPPPPVDEGTRHRAEAEPAAAVLLGHGDGQQSSVGERAPELTVDTLLAALDLLHSLGSRVAIEDLRRQVADRFLLLGEREVHCLPTYPHWDGRPGGK